MMRRFGKRSAWAVALAGGLGLTLAGSLVVADPGHTFSRLRESGFDRMLSLFPRKSTAQSPVIVDIDRASLAKFGPWPWPRDRLALLIGRIADAAPKGLVIDMLLPERGTDAADRRLAQAIARVPTVLGVVLDPDNSGGAEIETPILISEGVRLPGLLAAPGMIAPAPVLHAEARGLGVLSLPVPEGQPVRAVALLTLAQNRLVAGLAVEAVKLQAGTGTLIASADPQKLRIGAHAVPLPADGLMRLHFSKRDRRSGLVIRAEDLLTGAADARRFKGKLVFLGSSAPEAGGLRLTPVDPFMPSVVIAAEATEQIVQGHVPYRAPGTYRLETAAGVMLGAAAVILVMVTAPVSAICGTLALLLAWIGAAAYLTLGRLWLTDPTVPVIIALIAFQGAGLTHFAHVYRQRLAIERRFALHLSPEIVRRIADNPEELKLAGESRTVTALTTDIEGFTALTERIGPEAVVALLDRYFDIVAGTIVAHGGMIDKMVGDAVHALFNAPVDLPDHARKAVLCAQAIVGATEKLTQEPQFARARLGRTRIGVETGRAVLGEVGLGTKRDYTAYGRVVNMAARLQAANKLFGSSIAIGPGTAEALDGAIPLRPLGRTRLAGLEEEIEIFTPKQG
jgi:adenylate cyclase